MKETYFVGTEFVSTNLEPVNLNASAFQGVDFSDLKGVNLSYAILVNVNLSGAGLSGANMVSASMSDKD